MGNNSYLTVTNFIVIILVLSFFVQNIYEDYIDFLRFSTGLIFDEPYRAVTYLFVHGSLIHIFQNAYALFIFGNLLERKFNWKEVVKLFLLGGVVGMISQIFAFLLGFASPTAIGASDAVSAIFGACVFLALNENIEVFFIKMKVRTAFILFLIYELAGILNIFTFGPYANVAHAAHIGPFIFGYLYARIFLGKK